MHYYRESFEAIHNFYLEIAGTNPFDSYQAIQHFSFFILFLIWLIRREKGLSRAMSFYFAITFFAITGAMLQIKLYLTGIVFLVISMLFFYDGIKCISIYKFSLKNLWAVIFLAVGLWYPVYGGKFFLSPYGLIPQPTILVVISTMLMSDNLAGKIVCIPMCFLGVMYSIFWVSYFDIFLFVASVLMVLRTFYRRVSKVSSD